MSSTAWLWWHHVKAYENFLSEAVALATRVDGRPLVRALASVPMMKDPDRVRSIRASTQYHVGTRDHREGIVDIRLEIDTVGGPAEIWLEAKVSAPLTTQVSTYLNAIQQLTSDERPELVLFGVTQGYAAAPHLNLVSWQEVHDAVEEADVHIWRELQQYLREQGLAREIAA